ncbi:MAG: PP-loop domain-containing protein [Acidobacteria bacterium]|nr:PP-loop domain-containing protein [Acidobacteriota bacterium]
MKNLEQLERALLRRVGEAVGKFRMIRDGDRVAVAVSGGKDSLTLLEALLLLEKRSPARFTVCAFTVEQGKFLRPIAPLGDFMKARVVSWTYFHDKPSLRLLEEQPDHGCDLCSRYRRRAVYEIARGLGANVIAFGHTADDFCEALLRNTLFTGRISALPPVAYSRARDFRLIRPLVYVSEEITTAYAAQKQFPLVPCGCGERTGTVRRRLREFLVELEKEQPHVRQNILSAMGNIDTRRLLDTRFLSLDAETTEAGEPDLIPILSGGE